MAPRDMITAMAVLCFMLGILSPASAAYGSNKSKACCTTHSKKPIPFQRIKGYREQTTRENCRIEAIIFYTVRKNEICATRKDAWVKRTLALLGTKLKKMSKTGSAAAETPVKNAGNPSVHDGSGSFFNTTQASLNYTESLY